MQSLTQPLHLAGHELVPTLLKLGSAVSLDSTRTATLRHLGTRFLAHRARHQAALQMLARCGAGRGAACAVRQRAAAEVRLAIDWASPQLSSLRSQLAAQAVCQSRAGRCTTLHEARGSLVDQYTCCFRSDKAALALLFWHQNACFGQDQPQHQSCLPSSLSNVRAAGCQIKVTIRGSLWSPCSVPRTSIWLKILVI